MVGKALNDAELQVVHGVCSARPARRSESVHIIALADTVMCQSWTMGLYQFAYGVYTVTNATQLIHSLERNGRVNRRAGWLCMYVADILASKCTWTYYNSRSCMSSSACPAHMMHAWSRFHQDQVVCIRPISVAIAFAIIFQVLELAAPNDYDV